MVGGRHFITLQVVSGHVQQVTVVILWNLESSRVAKDKPVDSVLRIQLLSPA